MFPGANIIISRLSNAELLGKLYHHHRYCRKGSKKDQVTSSRIPGEVNMERVCLVLNVMCEPVLYLLLFRLIGPEYSVPDNKCSTVVLVDVFFL